MKKGGLYLLLMICWGCADKAPAFKLSVSIADGNHFLKVSGLDKAIIAEISRDTGAGAWQNLLPVYKMPTDTDLKDYQDPQPGKYRTNDSLVIFIPDTPFKKGQPYFLRYYTHQEGANAWQYINGKKRPGSLSYKDLAFSY